MSFMTQSPPSLPPDEGNGPRGARNRLGAIWEWWKALNARSSRWVDTWGLILPTVGLLMVTIFGLPTFLDASRNEGTWGTFTAVEKHCEGRGGCYWVGVFTSDDGTVYDDEAEFDEGIKRAGDEVRAQAVGDAGELYSDHDRTWLYILAADVPATLYVLWWLRVRRWKGTRSEQRALAATREQ
jgi:hypothetical protein